MPYWVTRPESAKGVKTDAETRYPAAMSKPTTRTAPGFLFATCQQGAEAALKREIARSRPGWRLAYSRPGFVTFKLPPEQKLTADFDLKSVFARAYALSLGKVTGDDPAALAEAAWRLARDLPVQAVHAWQRDPFTPGFRGFEPGVTDIGRQAYAALVAGRSAPAPDPDSQIAPRGALVLDCVVVEPGEWWIGFHKTRSLASRWPGGMPPLVLPPHAVSRAYLKMEEALRWSQFPLRPGDLWAEFGCAPGGAAQALLDHGLCVLGIDPAAVDPALLAHPNFRHVRARTRQVRRREFQDVHFVVSDMNVAPNYTLDAVGDVVTSAAPNVEGVILTLKLAEWELADEIPKFLKRVSGWGLANVQARQLTHNRQEICVTASRATARSPQQRSKRSSAQTIEKAVRRRPKSTAARHT
jgi:23S rRNA (cytidine2498-2'-O)-methyltransferase